MGGGDYILHILCAIESVPWWIFHKYTEHNLQYFVDKIYTHVYEFKILYTYILFNDMGNYSEQFTSNSNTIQIKLIQCKWKL